MSIFNKVMDKHLEQAQKEKEAIDLAKTQREKAKKEFVTNFEQAIEVDVETILKQFVEDATGKGYPAKYEKFASTVENKTSVLKLSFIPKQGAVIEDFKGDAYFLKINGVPATQTVEYSSQVDPYRGEDGIHHESYGIQSLVPQRFNERLEAWLQAALKDWKHRHPM